MKILLMIISASVALLPLLASGKPSLCGSQKSACAPLYLGEIEYFDYFEKTRNLTVLNDMFEDVQECGLDEHGQEYVAVKKPNCIGRVSLSYLGPGMSLGQHLYAADCYIDISDTYCRTDDLFHQCFADVYYRSNNQAIEHYQFYAVKSTQRDENKRAVDQEVRNFKMVKKKCSN